MRAISVAGAVVGFVLLAAPGAAAAEGLVVDGTSVSAEGDGDTLTAEITVLNTRSAPVSLEGLVETTGDCTKTLAATELLPHQPNAVELKLSRACFDNDDEVTFDLDAEGPLPAVTIEGPKEDHNWDPLLWAAPIALVLALLIMYLARLARLAANGTGDDPVERELAYRGVRDVVDARVAGLAPRPELPWVDDLPARKPLEPSSQVENLEAGWSFKESWVSNITVATTGFVALATSADVFTAILQEQQEAALRVMTVAGLISAALIALANTVVKLLGTSKDQVTVRGLVLSSALVVFAAILQVATVGLGAQSLLSGAPAAIPIVLMVLIGGAIVLYAAKVLDSAITNGRASGLPDVPANAVEAWAAEDAWAKLVVYRQLQKYYADWLDLPKGRQAHEPASELPALTGFSLDEWAGDSRRASLL